MKKIYILLLFSLLLSSCIEEFVPTGVDNLRDLLVVEGAISDGEMEIKLSKSVGLEDDVKDASVVDNAQVTVESDNGTVYTLIHQQNGSYMVNIASLDVNQKYRLRIKLDGQEYESDYATPQITPEIDEILFEKERQGSPVLVLISTHADNNHSRYYKWSFNEIWESPAPLYAQADFDANGEPYRFDEINGPHNYKYYCWRYNNSRSLILGSSDKLSENVIRKKKILSLNPEDSRFSTLYYIKVRQNMISKAAYDYYSNLQKNIEQTGSIFGPIPSEMKGNIRCITDSEIPVIGYVEVSRTVSREEYVAAPNELYEATPKICRTYTQQEVDDPEGVGIEPYTIFSVEQNIFTGKSEIIYAPLRCVDCRYNGGSKNRPDFWPNDHK